ncbi:hypothetical protein ASD54_07540 [Rhizobium sp. Root149]|uniref:hypothetical protein n=1 Tax=Rhizobium sp. Root149 TaxID=1736473 RepID=UPI000715DCCA|nr:hypothetical protein [Rhizobium sp. Root149]KQZ55123.1 hypothetical protein ASD54_07540 [Rhizobium sp. Root149]
MSARIVPASERLSENFGYVFVTTALRPHPTKPCRLEKRTFFAGGFGGGVDGTYSLRFGDRKTALRFAEDQNRGLGESEKCVVRKASSLSRELKQALFEEESWRLQRGEYRAVGCVVLSISRAA